MPEFPFPKGRTRLTERPKYFVSSFLIFKRQSLIVITDIVEGQLSETEMVQLPTIGLACFVHVLRPAEECAVRKRPPET